MRTKAEILGGNSDPESLKLLFAERTLSELEILLSNENTPDSDCVEKGKTALEYLKMLRWIKFADHSENTELAQMISSIEGRVYHSYVKPVEFNLRSDVSKIDEIFRTGSCSAANFSDQCKDPRPAVKYLKEAAQLLPKKKELIESAIGLYFNLYLELQCVCVNYCIDSISDVKELIDNEARRVADSAANYDQITGNKTRWTRAVVSKTLTRYFGTTQRLIPADVRRPGTRIIKDRLNLIPEMLIALAQRDSPYSFGPLRVGYTRYNKGKGSNGLSVADVTYYDRRFVVEYTPRDTDVYVKNVIPVGSV